MTTVKTKRMKINDADAIKLYVEVGLTERETAEWLGCHQTTVHLALARHGIERRHHKTPVTDLRKELLRIKKTLGLILETETTEAGLRRAVRQLMDLITLQPARTQRRRGSTGSARLEEGGVSLPPTVRRGG